MNLRRIGWLNLLLIFVPIAIVLRFSGAPGLWVFAISSLSIIPLAGLMGKSTEMLSDRLGAGWGGLLNATFGNAAELIIAIFALRQGMVEVVKASITGSRSRRNPGGSTPLPCPTRSCATSATCWTG